MGVPLRHGQLDLANPCPCGSPSRSHLKLHRRRPLSRSPVCSKKIARPIQPLPPPSRCTCKPSTEPPSRNPPDVACSPLIAGFFAATAAAHPIITGSPLDATPSRQSTHRRATTVVPAVPIANFQLNPGAPVLTLSPAKFPSGPPSADLQTLSRRPSRTAQPAQPWASPVAHQPPLTLRPVAAIAEAIPSQTCAVRGVQTNLWMSGSAVRPSSHLLRREAT